MAMFLKSRLEDGIRILTHINEENIYRRVHIMTYVYTHMYFYVACLYLKKKKVKER